MKKLFFLLSTVFLFACSQTESVMPEKNADDTFNVSFTIEDLASITFGESTRGVIDDKQNGKYLFTDNDSLGIFPVGGYQIPFVVSGIGAGKAVSKVSLSAEGWNTKPGVKYVAYSHFQFDNKSANAVPFSYLRQRQKNNGDNSHLVDYSFIASNATEYNNGFNFTLTEQGVIFKLILNLPEVGIFNKVVLKSSKEDNFALEGTYDLFSEKLDRTVTNASSVVSVNLDNIETTAANKTLTAYIFVANQGLVPDLTVKVYAVDGTVYSSSKTINYNFPRAFQANITYSNFETEQASSVTESVDELNSILESAAVNKENVVNAELNSTNVTNEIIIPEELAKQPDTSINLVFNDAPVLGSEITITDETDDKPAKKSLSEVDIKIPEAIEESEAPSFIINLPSSTVTLEAKESTATYNKVVASTANNTLRVAQNVTVKELEVRKGNVVVYGFVDKIYAEEDCTATVIGNGSISFIDPTGPGHVTIIRKGSGLTGEGTGFVWE